MDKIIVRRFKFGDEKQIVALIREARRKINIRDYDEKLIEELCNEINEDIIRKRASKYHTYIIELQGEIIGIGSIGHYKENINEAEYHNIYILPKYEKKGIGKLIIKTLENDEYYKKSERIEIHSSITAMEFYKHMGYKFKKFGNIVDDGGEYRLEKYTKEENNKNSQIDQQYNMRPFINNKYYNYKDFVYKTIINSNIKDIKHNDVKSSKSENKNDIEEFLDNNKNKLWIIQLNGNDIGFYADKEYDEKQYEIINLCLIPEYQNNGMEEQIVKDIVELHNDQYIYIKQSVNNKLRQTVERLGFKINTQDSFYYYKI